MSFATAVLPVKRGQTWFDGGTTDTTSAEKLLGSVRTTNDTVNGTSRETVIRLVRNDSGGSLSPGQPVCYSTARYGLSVTVGSPLQARFAGFVDDAYPSTIASNDVFWIVQAGPGAMDSNTSVLYPSFYNPGFVHPVQDFTRFEIRDDFGSYVSGGVWTTTSDSGGAVAAADADGGEITITTAGTNNDGEYIRGTKQNFTLVANRPIALYARLKVTEAATNQAAVFVGLTSTTATGSIPSGGATPATSFSGACFFKAKSTLQWATYLSNSTTQTTTANAGTYASAAYNELYLDWYATSATAHTAKFYVNGVLGSTLTGLLASLAAMAPCIGVKSGGSAEVINVDRFYCAQIRA